MDLDKIEPIQEDNIKIELSLDDERKIQEYKSKIDFSASTKIIQYGVSSQNQLRSFSDEILNQVRTKDLGPASDILLNLRTNINSFDEAVNKKSFLPFLDNIKKRIARIKAEYTKVDKNIATIEIQLEKHYQTLAKDINILDKLFEKNQEYFKDLSLHILAGEEKIKEMRQEVLPQMQVEASLSNNQVEIQKYRDLEQQVTNFEKKAHDLKLTRMVTLQTSPQIRMIQSSSSALMEKLQSSIVNTLPLWKNQMVLTLGLVHSQQALEAQKAVTDATNELLKRNSELLKDSTIKIARESERGIIDIETIRKTNADLISTINEVLRIQQDGREKRLVVEAELYNAETELKNRLIATDQQ